MKQCHLSKKNKQGFFKNLATKYHTVLFTLKFIPSFRSFLKFVRCYIKVNLFKKDQIRFVEIFVTLACNARCDFCSNDLFTNKRGDISTEKYLSIIDECAALGVPVVCLIGGEPLLYKGLNRLIERIHYHGMVSMIATNGYLLTEEKVKELAKAGLTSITISLHSINEEEHDNILKLKGAYAKAFKAKEDCDKYGMVFQLASVASHHDFTNGNFDKMVEFVEEKKIPLSVNAIIPTGGAVKHKDDLLRAEDVKKLNEISYKSNYVSTHLTNNFFGFGCPAGNSYLGINATGEMFPCFFMPISLGNVHKMTLREAWNKARNNPVFKKKYKMCYAGVSREFIEKYMDPVFKFENVPIAIEDHPAYDEKIGGLPELECPETEEAINYHSNKSTD